MRILRILSGIAVLFTSLGYAHLFHHHLMHASSANFHSPAFLLMTIFALVAGVFSFIGAILLLKGPA
jgi:hypothetical protein